MAIVTWLGGANILIAFHNRRVGKPAWSALKSFTFAFTGFNALEWLVFALLAAVALTFLFLAISLPPR
jgi:heme/copper-type cytochrome/quinol oxidase subunit 1